MSIPLCSSSLAGRKDHAILLREYVSSKSPGKGRAVLEALGLDAEVVDMSYGDNPRSEEAAVQAGLLKWVGSHDATWEVLIGAMKHGGIAVQHIAKLKEELLKGVCMCSYISSNVVFAGNPCIRPTLSMPSQVMNCHK